ncbi:prenyltransferase/squalene oxidase repeat-containing protein [Streptomyces sp. NPDC049585]|uniref:prenyltransferase/squalene oxidase repeat-containing protein n=1 Tax=Streptomyces sp. NPDC049585 TaxID=3155154 RepID=UPI00341B616C
MNAHDAVPDDVRTAYEAACTRLLSLQSDDGSWEGEMEWNTTILSQYVIVLRVLQRPPDEGSRQGMVTHFRNTRTPEGGWGMHPAAPPSPYATLLAYVALRLLGLGPGDPLTAGARKWLGTQPGGARCVPQWGRFWLAVLGIVPYREVAPFPPEAMLLPRWFPLHPERLLGWTRMLYQAMSYLYGARFRADLGPLADALRRELFATPATPSAPGPDVVFPRGRLLRALQQCLRGWERVHSRRLRRAALERCHHAVVDEQYASPVHGLSSVNALMECLVLFAHDRRHPMLDAAVARLEYWRWADEKNGVRICGERSLVWDTTFAVQALLAAGPQHRSEQAASALHKACTYLRAARITTYPGLNPPLRKVIGGWAFSDGDSRWPVGDCTAEAVDALLGARDALGSGAGPAGTDGPLPPRSLSGALDVILDRQNRDGGFGTLDRQRTGRWLDVLNPTEMFAQCMVDSSSVDCTGSALTALARMRGLLPPRERRRADAAIRRGATYLRSAQNPDGSFAGTWGINYTYAAFHAARGLRAAGAPPDDPALRLLGHWLTATQLADGGWGEDWRGCVEQRYIALGHALPEMTSWAVLAGLDTLGPGSPSVAAGVRWLCTAQEADGSWSDDHVNAVFFATMMINYRLYAAYFPTLALGRYLRAVTPITPRGAA